MNKNKLANLLLVFLLTLSALVIGFVAGQKINIDNADWKNTSLSEIDKNQVSIMVDYGNQPTKSYHDVEIQEGDSLASAMARYFEANDVELAIKEYPGLGVLIDQIGERKNGDDNRYWQYWVNNVMVQVSAGDFYPKPGDIIIWKFAPHYEQ